MEESTKRENLTFNQMQFLYPHSTVYCIFNEQERLYTPVIPLEYLKYLSKEEKTKIFAKHQDKNMTIFQGQRWIMKHRLL